MSKVLYLAYHYPPIGGAAVQRNSRLAKYLRDAGFELVVVTGRGTRPGRWTPRDATLEADVLPGMKIFRVDGEDSFPPSGTWRSRCERWLGLRKRWERWWTRGVLGLSPSLVDEDVDLIYAQLVPFESFDAARHLSRVLHKPLVIDLHDPWALDEMIVYPTAMHRAAARRTMRRALRAADGIVFNTPEALQRAQRAFPEIRSKPIAVITNGFDGRDFVSPVAPRTDAAFRIVHTGYLHTDGGRQQRRRFSSLRHLLGGTMSGVEILTRSHVYLLEAVEELLAREPDLDPVEIHLAGVTTPDDYDAARTSARVVFCGYLPHGQSVDLVRTADLLFLPMHNVMEGACAGIMPGKTFEYLASGRPILAAVPPGDVRDLLQQAGNAYICAPNDTTAMGLAIREQIRRTRNGDLLPQADSELVAQFDWSVLAALVGAMCERVLNNCDTSVDEESGREPSGAVGNPPAP